MEVRLYRRVDRVHFAMECVRAHMFHEALMQGLPQQAYAQICFALMNAAACQRPLYTKKAISDRGPLRAILRVKGCLGGPWSVQKIVRDA